MDSLKDLLKDKADDIDNSGTRSDIQVVQAELDRYFKGGLKVSSINKGVATVTTRSAPMASDMRMQQTQLIEDLNSNLQTKLIRFIIRIV